MTFKATFKLAVSMHRRINTFQRSGIAAVLYLLLLWLSTAPSLAIAAGDQLYTEHCSACHSLDVDSPPRVGPQLTGVVGRAAGDSESYVYSKALRAKADAGLQWNGESLKHFLAAPAEFMPGTSMNYSGMAEAVDRETLIEWLATAPAEDQRRASEAALPATPEVQAILTLNADPEFGEYLASECLTCHQSADSSGGVPPIDGLRPAYFVQALLDYKSRVRSNSVMQLMAGNLGDDELAALAAFFENSAP